VFWKEQDTDFFTRQKSMANKAAGEALLWWVNSTCQSCSGQQFLLLLAVLLALLVNTRDTGQSCDLEPTTQTNARRTTRERKKTNGNTTTQPNGTPDFEFTGKRGEIPTKLDKLAWLVMELTGTITQQNQTIEALKRCCEELKAGQQSLHAQNLDLKDKITSLRAQNRRDQNHWQQ
jgi:FtsZ-binding cell division protein ZapB